MESDVIARALTKTPAERYQSAHSFKGALQAVLSGMIPKTFLPEIAASQNVSESTKSATDVAIIYGKVVRLLWLNYAAVGFSAAMAFIGLLATIWSLESVMK